MTAEHDCPHCGCADNEESINRLAQDCAQLREALRGLLLSADCEWESTDAGHDWHAACDAARAALAPKAQ